MQLITNETEGLEEMKVMYTGADHVSVEGHHIPVPDDKVSFAYISKTGWLKVSRNINVALDAGQGKCVMVSSDEVQFDKSNAPYVKNVEYPIHGIFENEKGKGVYLDAAEREPHYLYGTPTAVVTHPNSKRDLETYRKLYKIYVAMM